MSVFRAEHIVRSHSITIPVPPERALRLFEPEGEREWAPDWQPEYLYPTDGRAARGMVFTTAHGGERTIWTMTRHEPAAGVVEYHRVTPGSRTGSVTVRCAPAGAGSTRITVVYELTGLSEEGNLALRELDEAGYRAYIESWGEQIGALGPRATR